MAKNVLAWVMLGVVACGGRVVREPEEPPAAFCGDGMRNAPDEECDDAGDDCVACRFVGATSDECGVMGTCADGQTSYRCSGPAAGVPVTLDGAPVLGSTFVGVDPPGGFLYCGPPACVRLAGGDVNCSATAGKWLRCPAGDDDRSAIAVPDGCEFKGRIGESAGYCCE